MKINFSIPKIFDYFKTGKIIKTSIYIHLKIITNIELKSLLFKNNFINISNTSKKYKYYNNIKNSALETRFSNLYKTNKSYFSTISKKYINTNIRKENNNRNQNKIGRNLNEGNKDSTQIQIDNSSSILNNMTNLQKQYYFNDIKNIYFDFNFGPKFKFTYLGIHISSMYFILNINNFLQFYWLYQTFYGLTMFSIAYLNYEVYFDLNQKKTLDRFIKLM
jgi:hypothetical protein